MKITLKTEALQEVVAKAAKGAGNLSMLAITSAIGIEVKNGDLILTTTDNNTNLSVKLSGVSENLNETFYACTNADLFCKLIAKQTEKKIILETLDSCLQIVGDGVYNLPLIQDEEGQIARITPIEVDGLSTIDLEAGELKKMLKYNKLAVSKLYDEPIYTGYCVADNKVYTYNGSNACISEVNLRDLKLLIPSKMVDLFDLFDDKKVSVIAVSNLIKFESTNICITGSLLEGFEQYPAGALKDTVYSEQFESSVKVKKNVLHGALDRLSLFISDKEQHALHITFAKEAVMLSNMDSNAGESVPYVNTPDVKEAELYVDINDLKVITDAITDEEITFIYGSPSAMGVCAGNMRFVLSLLSDDEDVSSEDIENEEPDMIENDSEEIDEAEEDM